MNAPTRESLASLIWIITIVIAMRAPWRISLFSNMQTGKIKIVYMHNEDSLMVVKHIFYENEKKYDIYIQIES